MECPKCGFAQDGDPAECSRCGILFAKFLRAQEHVISDMAGQESASVQADIERCHAERNALRHELRVRAVALPSSLLTAWLAVKTAPGIVRMFSMWVHESGHAVAAWLCGYAAWPGPWFTPVGSHRSIVMTALLAGLLVFGGFRAWRRGRWFWVVAATLVLVLALFCSVYFNTAQAQQMITFGGDGGCFVLGTVMMLTMYARSDHPIRREHLRWALLLFGALAFMDAYFVWSGSFDRLPFGQSENGLSDPSVLAEEFGWSVLLLVHRYLELARVCFFVLVSVYIVGIAEPAIALLPERDVR
jgi:hypothetical protein